MRGIWKNSTGAQNVGLTHSVPPHPNYLFSVSGDSQIPSFTKLTNPSATGNSALLIVLFVSPNSQLSIPPHTAQIYIFQKCLFYEFPREIAPQ